MPHPVKRIGGGGGGDPLIFLLLSFLVILPIVFILSWCCTIWNANIVRIHFDTNEAMPIRFLRWNTLLVMLDLVNSS